MLKKLSKSLRACRIISGKLITSYSFVRPIILAVSLTLLGFAKVFAGDREAKWSIKLDEKIKWYHATFPGVLIVATDDYLRGINPDNGSILWRMDSREIKNQDDFWPVYGTPYAVIFWGRGQIGKNPARTILDVTTGREIWKTTTLGVKEFTEDFMLWPLNALMFSGKKVDNDRKGFLMTADLQTGTPVWKIDDIFDKNWKGIRTLRFPLYDSDETMILFSQNDFLRKLDYHTGKTIWEVKGTFKSVDEPDERKKFWTPGQPEEPRKPPEKIGAHGGDLDGYAPLLMSPEKDRVYVPYNNTVRPASTDSGKPLWKKLPPLGGGVTQMELIPQGLLVRTATDEMKPERIWLLDAATGEVKWKYPNNKKGGFFGKVLDELSSKLGNQFSNFIVTGKYAVVVENKDLLTIDLATGLDVHLAELPTGENAGTVSLDLRDDGFLLTAQQDIFWFDFTPKQIRHVHYNPPDDMFKGAMLLLGAWAGNTLPHGTRPYISFSYEPGTQALMREYHSSSQVEDFFFMLANLEEKDYGGPALLKIDKNTGETVGTIPVKKKEPNYILDNLHNRAFLLSEKKEITCYEW